MQSKFLLVAVILLVFAGTFLAKGLLRRSDSDPAPEPQEVNRIVSLAPSITETLFALGAGDRVVGVTEFCKYPPEAQEKPRVGGHLNPNFEAIVALEPDLVVLLAESRQSRLRLKELGVNTLAVSHKNIEGILQSLTAIGDALGKREQEKAANLVGEIRARMRHVLQKTASPQRPRVMLVIDRVHGSGTLEGVYVAGADGYFEKIIEIAGGQSVLAVEGPPYPMVSVEAILDFNPQVIIDVVPNMADLGLDRQTVREDWQQLGEIEAVKTQQVYVFDEDYASIPGPRFILLIEKLARVLHPEVNWD